MPQFDPHNFAPQLAWLAIIFAILYFGVVRLTLPKVGKVVDGRTARVDGDITAAATAKAQSDSMTAAYERDIAAARAQAQAAITTSHDATASEIEGRLAALDAELAAHMQAAEAAIAARRDTALAEVDSLAKSLGDDIVARLLGTPSPVGAA